ncbi:MAG TPA: hypothetical protein VEW69_09220, partial [Alphaproteobacteria bacterium]|nr:hypothetical protein [Alphaproteobacteria bacterium]
GDGKVEVLAVVRDNSVETMYVWQIQQDGDLREIQRIEGYGVHTQADRFMGQGLGIILERKVQNSATGEFCYPTEEYVWSVKQQQFVKR